MPVGAPRCFAVRGSSGAQAAQVVQHGQDLSRRGAAGLAGVDRGVGDEPCPIDDEAGGDRQRPTLASPIEKWEVDATLPVDVSEELRNAPAHAVRENRNTQVSTARGPLRFSVAVCSREVRAPVVRRRTRCRTDP